MNDAEKKEAWEEIMDKAKKAGFIRFAYAGVAILNINEEEEKMTKHRFSIKQLAEFTDKQTIQILINERTSELKYRSPLNARLRGIALKLDRGGGI